jgi:cellulose synthase operon protein C
MRAKQCRLRAVVGSIGVMLAAVWISPVFAKESKSTATAQAVAGKDTGKRASKRERQKRKTTPSDALYIKRTPTSEETETLDESRKEDLEIYIRRTRDFKDVVDGMVRRVYEMKREFIENAYEKSIEEEWRLEEQSLKDAIAYFKAFLKKYPNTPPFTPDAMYRLGELYYDQSYVTYQKALDKYGEAQERGEAEQMTPPTKDFTNTISLFQELVERYPEYRNIDGAYYVLGYCLKESGRDEEARLAWLNGVCQNRYHYDPVAFKQEKEDEAKARPKKRPASTLDTGVEEPVEAAVFKDPFEGCQPISTTSRFNFESWWLIGEYHFDYDTSRFGVETAISAYKKLLENPDHKFYDKGLYKLAWSYFKADMYPESIKAFSEVVDFADRSKTKGGSMRPEAIQYLAVCFFTEDWDVDMVPDPVSGIERLQDPSLMPQDKPWTREVYERLGDIYSDNERNEEAIALWKLYVKKWPLDVRTPFVQQKIALEYGKMREPELEIAARSELDKYGPDTEWWEANKDNPVEQNEVAEMTRDAILEAAYHFHRTAQGLRQRGLASQDGVLLERAVEKYNLAAEAYRKYIQQNPDTPDAYDINFNLAETLFWSGQYELAKVEYKKVRDSNLDDRYRTDAGYMVIVCLEEMFKRQESSGALVLRSEPPEVSGEPPMVATLEIPPLVQELMNEREFFLKDSPQHEDAGKFRYQTAQNYYRYGQWDKAKVRYEAIYDDYCKKDPIAYVSWQTMMNMATDMNNIDERERLALLQQQKKCSTEGLEELTGGEAEVIDIETILGDVAMRRALEMLKTCMDGKDQQICSEAGDALVAAVSKAPDHPDADKALHNAALAYEIGQRFDSAMKLYGRIVEEYPKSEFVGKCLFQQASAANNFFEYDKALENYRILADESRFEKYENRTVSVYNAAYIMTNLQRYSAAIPYWERYAKEETDVSKSVEASFNAADMYFREKKWRKAVDAYEKFIRSKERVPEAQSFLVKAAYRTALSEKELGRNKNQTKAWERTVALYGKKRTPGSMSAEYAASSHFQLIEIDMRKFEKFKIRGKMKTINEKIATGIEKVKALEKRYREIAAYGRPEWSLAAEFRIGYAYEVFAKALLDVPFPPLDPKDEKMLRQLPREDRELVKIELEDRFRAEMEKQVAPMEDKAQEEYRIAVDLARKGSISNEWTLLALERMNAYDPENYPRQHNGFIERQSDTLAAPPFAAEVK